MHTKALTSCAPFRLHFPVECFQVLNPSVNEGILSEGLLSISFRFRDAVARALLATSVPRGEVAGKVGLGHPSAANCHRAE